MKRGNYSFHCSNVIWMSGNFLTKYRGFILVYVTERRGWPNVKNIRAITRSFLTLSLRGNTIAVFLGDFQIWYCLHRSPRARQLLDRFVNWITINSSFMPVSSINRWSLPLEYRALRENISLAFLSLLFEPPDNKASYKEKRIWQACRRNK